MKPESQYNEDQDGGGYLKIIFIFFINLLNIFHWTYFKAPNVYVFNNVHELISKTQPFIIVLLKLVLILSDSIIYVINFIRVGLGYYLYNRDVKG